jgi:colanic acid biosynthesis glycosyl transferase WcaI
LNTPIKSITILTQYFFPEPGAAQIRLGELAKTLKRKNIDVQVITGMPNYPKGKIFKGYNNKFIKREIWNGIPIKRVWLYPASGRGSIPRLLNYLSFSFLSFWLLLFSKRSELIFVEAQPITLAIPALVVKYLRGIPYVYNTPDLQIEHAEEAGWIPFSSIIKIAKKMEEFLMNESLYVTVVTKSYINHFIEHRGQSIKKIKFFPNGANTKELYQIKKDYAYMNKFGIKDHNLKIFTYAGTHAPYQGLETIIYAADLLKDRSDIALLMAGKGPESKNLKNLSKSMGIKNLHFINSPFEEMKELMSITYASIVVLKDKPTARKQRLSKVIPPLACGVPVIFAGFGESADMLNENNCGITVEPDNPEKLSKAILKICENETLRNNLGNNGFLYVKKELSWDVIIDNWLDQIQT